MLDDQMKDKESIRNAILNFREGQIIAGKYRLISSEPSIGDGVVKDIGRGGLGLYTKRSKCYTANYLCYEQLSFTSLEMILQNLPPIRARASQYKQLSRRDS